MNDHDAYQAWLEKRRNLYAPDSFSRQIVDQIRRERQATHRPNSKRLMGQWLEWISQRPLAQSATIAAAAIAGIVRLILILQIVFSF
jgi:hypothetical protein